jgi:enediyne biosynthesis protein E4
LYVKDFDRNGSVEQIMCYTIDGKEYTFLAKDELEQALPVLKKGYLTYNEVAGKTVQYMFDDLFKDYRELKAETLSSSCFIGDGKGGFTRMDLPDELQLSPLFTFAPVMNNNKVSFFGAGNFYGVLPYEGRYDAMQPAIFGYEKNGFIVSGMQPVDGEIRNAKWLNTTDARGRKILVVAGNNTGLTFLK